MPVLVPLAVLVPLVVAGTGPRPTWGSRSSSRCSTRPPPCSGSAGGRPSRDAGLGPAGYPGGRLLVAGGPAARAAGGDRRAGRLHAGGDAADLARRRPDPGQHGQRVGAVRHLARGLRALLRPAGPTAGVRDGRPADRDRVPALAAFGRGHHERAAPHPGRAGAGPVLRGAPRAAAVAAGPGRPGRAGAVPARGTGPDRGTGPAGRRDARRGDAPGQPDGAAGRGAADDRARRADPAGGRGPAGDRLPGPGRTARSGRDPACASGRRRDAVHGRPGGAGRRIGQCGHSGRADRGWRSGPGLAGGRADHLPHCPGGPDQRAQARAGHPGDRTGQLRPLAAAADHPQHPAGPGGGRLRPGRGRLQLGGGRLPAGRDRLRPGYRPAPAASGTGARDTAGRPLRDGGFCVEATLPAYVPTAESAA